MSDVQELDAFLAHHGVKGMKWGVRKREEAGSLDPNQKSLLAGYGLLYGTIAAVTLTYRGIQSGEFHSIKERGRAFIHGKDLPWKVKPELAKKNMSVDELMTKVVGPINPGTGPGSRANCRRCTFAYEMRRRGMDVAATNTSIALGGSNKQLFKATHPEKNKSESYKQFANTSHWGKNRTSPDKVFSDLAKQPNGARGDLSMHWSIGGAHSVAWEIVKNKPVIIDAQNRKVYKNSKEFANSTLQTKWMDDMAYTRLDNVSLNHKNLTRWLKDA